MAKKRLFRQKSLDRLASPERLDTMIQVTTPKSWLLLMTLLTLIAVVVGWSFLGSIPTKVKGDVVFIRTGGLNEITASSDGRLTDLSIRVGDRVHQGQLIGRLSQPLLDAELNQVMFELEELQTWQAWLENLSSLRGSAQTMFVERQRQTLIDRIVSLEERLEVRNELLERGLITRQEVLETRDELGSLRGQLRQIDLSELESEAGIQQELDDLQRRINLMQLNREHLFRMRDENVQLRSPYAGTIVELRINQGRLVQPGTSIAAVEPDGRAVKRLEAVLFLPAYEGRRVHAGMEVLLSPAGIRKEEHGLMIGRVTSVSEYPVTWGSIHSLLQNEQLVDQVLGQGASYQVMVDLVPEPDNFSGFRWTSPGGPRELITGGVIGEGEITVQRQRPISLLIPTVRSLVGL